MRLSWKHYSVIIIILSTICTGLWHYTQSVTPSDILSVSFLDIGQGDAIYIRAPNGNDILIDGGPDDSVVQQLASVMPVFDHDIDMIIETHPDKDHVAGLVSIFQHYDVKKFLHSEIESGTSFDNALHTADAAEPDIENIIARRGERFILDDTHGIYLDILFPDQDTSHFTETNDASVVARLVYGDKSFLLTGDSPISVEQFLARTDGSRLKTTVLKLGHHGSKTSSSDEYLDQVRPEYAVVSAGKNNSYHHPNPSVVSRIQTRGIKLFSTIDLGTIIFQTDGKSIWVQ